MLEVPVKPHEIAALFAVLIALIFLSSSVPANASSLRYFGNGVNDIDRVKIRVDDPDNNNPGPPADIGATDFTIEFWLKATADNTAGQINCGNNYNWINGNIVFDRDRFNQGRTFGVSLGAGRLAFSAQNAGTSSTTICGTTDLRDGLWHHVAFERRRSDGFLWIYVDGALEASGDGPDGDISYPDNGNPGNFCSGSCDFSDPFIVIGAEKHDAGAAYPSFSGWVDEVRLSDILRYSGNFTPSAQAFVSDSNTVGLYHFDEGAGDFIGDSSTGGLSPGERRFGGNPAGPVWDTDTPFSGSSNSGFLQFSSVNFVVDEAAGSTQITVTRSGGSAAAVSVDYAVTGGSAQSGADFSLPGGTLQWADGDTSSKSIPVGIVEDSDVEGSETVTVTLSNVTGGAALGARSSTVLTIMDNDVAVPGQLQLSSSSYPVSEGTGTVNVTVTRTGGSDGAVSLNYATSNGTATAGADYQATSGTLSWSDGDATSKNFSIPITDDAGVESDETINVTLSNVQGGASLGSPASAVVTIADNDVAVPGQLQLSSSSYSVSEGAGTVSITVTRSGGSDGAVSVDYGTGGGTATASSDYQVASGTLSWSDGDGASKTFTITILDDIELESDESLNVTLSNAVGGVSLGSPSTAVVTITENDVAMPGQLQLSSSSYSTSEDASSVTITVTRTGGSTGAVSADFTTSDSTALAGADYVAASGTLSWPDGDATARSFVIDILDDTQVESPESVDIRLSNAIGGASLGVPAAAVLTITDDDTASAGVIELTNATYTVSETVGVATVSAIRRDGGSGSASVDVLISDGTATSGDDYVASVDSLDWADGDQSIKTLNLTILDDSIFEGDETVNIELANVSGASIGSPGNAILTIVDDEFSSPGMVRFSSADTSVNEGSGAISIGVSRVGGSSGTVSISVSDTGGGATEGVDYSFTDSALNWQDGVASTQFITLSILDDDQIEGAEQIVLSLENPSGGVAIDSPATLQITINDDDSDSRPSSGGSGSFGPVFIFTIVLVTIMRQRRSMLWRHWRTVRVLGLKSRLLF